jgi:hypothetical protein
MSAIKLSSPLPLSECMARLRAAINREGLAAVFGSRPVIGWVSDRSIRIRKRNDYQNAWQPVLRGEFEAHGAGTTFEGRLGCGLPALIVGTAYIALAAGVALLGVIEALRAVAAGVAPPVEAFGSRLLPLAFGLAIIGGGRWFARGEDAFLIAFVAKMIGAHRDEPAEPGAAPDRCKMRCF